MIMERSDTIPREIWARRLYPRTTHTKGRAMNKGTCPECDGWGDVRGAFVYCPACNGSGVVENRSHLANPLDNPPWQPLESY